MKLFTVCIFIALLTVGCVQNTAKSHTDTLLILNNDFSRYDNLFENELIGLYKQIEEIRTTDSIKMELISKAIEIKKHSNEFIQGVNKAITVETTSNSLTIPSFNNYYKLDWQNLKRDNFYLNNQYDEKSAFNIKDALNSFRMHLIYINQKNIHSTQLEQFLASSIMTANYLFDESWENTLIINKSTLDLITTLNKIKFEVKMSEFMAINYLKTKIEK